MATCEFIRAYSALVLALPRCAANPRAPQACVPLAAMRASRSRTRAATNLLTSTPDEVALAIACWLLTARDLLCLALTCRRFGIKCIVSAAGGGGAAAAAGPALSLSIVEEAARRYRLYRCSEQEQGWVPTYGVGLGLMHEVEVLRLPLAFGRAHANITLFENGAVATRTTIGGMGGSSYHSAASSIVMRSGRHFAQFTVQRGTDMAFGVLLASCDVEETSDALDDVNGVHYWTMSGGRFTGGYNWQGMQAAMAPGDRIGLLLDLDQGSMSVWKNGERLGVMLPGRGSTVWTGAQPLDEGEYCWAVSQCGEPQASGGLQSARIESAAAPPSPTQEELAAAAAWEAANEENEEIRRENGF